MLRLCVFYWKKCANSFELGGGLGRPLPYAKLHCSGVIKQFVSFCGTTLHLQAVDNSPFRAGCFLSSSSTGACLDGNGEPGGEA